jgi:hypothetical protein
MIVVIKSQTPAVEIERIIQELHRYPGHSRKSSRQTQSCHWLSG